MRPFRSLTPVPATPALLGVVSGASVQLASPKRDMFSLIRGEENKQLRKWRIKSNQILGGEEDEEGKRTVGEDEFSRQIATSNEQVEAVGEHATKRPNTT